MENIKIKILGKDISPTRLRLKGWTELESVRKLMDDAISQKDFDKYFRAIVQFTEMASIPSNEKIDWDKVPWFELLELYSEAVKINSPSIEFPILTSPDEKKEKKLPWEYDGRSWYFWFNLFASRYGWNENVIENLDIDSAIGLYQEILIEQQFEKEWEWGLSEMAFPYNKSTKKQEFKALARPKWMLPLAPEFLPVIKIRKDMMPVGNIVDLQPKK